MSSTVRYLTLVALAALGFASPRLGSAQGSLPLKHKGKPTQPAITTADAMTRMYIFADDSMMGRSAGTEGGLRGTAYLEREVRRLGLVPAGDSGTFFQAIPLYTRTLDMTSRLMIDATPLVLRQDVFPVHGGGTPRSIDGAQMIFAGSTADTGSMVAASQTVGKVVLVGGSTQGMSRRYPGAVAFMTLVSDPIIPQYARFVTTPSTTMRRAEDSLTRPMTLAIPVRSVATFLGVPLENARPGTLGRTFHGSIRYTVVDAPARNVVAILPGSDARLRNQYVAIGAHNDHVGVRRGGPLDHDSLRAFNEMAHRVYVARRGTMPSIPGGGLTAEERAAIKVNVDSLRRLRPARLDSIYNGADDDGSGSIGVLEVAEKFTAAKVKPRRSLLFVWHTAEELGLFGAEYFTENPTVPRDSIVAQINIDMIGRGEESDLVGGNAGYLQVLGSRRLSTEFGDLVESVNLGKAGFKLDYQYDASGHPEQYYCRSDHYEYAKYGIPIVFLSTGEHPDYHQLTDEPQYIRYPHLTRVANFVADIAERVANLDHRLVVDKAKPDPKGTCVQ